MAIQVDPNEIQEQGYVVLRNVIPPAQLDSLRTSYETLVDRQREIWTRDRGPDDPPGGAWETHHHPAWSSTSWLTSPPPTLSTSFLPSPGVQAASSFEDATSACTQCS